MAMYVAVMDFKDRLKAARKARGLTQQQLAEKAGLQPTAISHMEAGRRQAGVRLLERLVLAMPGSSALLLNDATCQSPSGDCARSVDRATMSGAQDAQIWLHDTTLEHQGDGNDGLPLDVWAAVLKHTSMPADEVLLQADDASILDSLGLTARYDEDDNPTAEFEEALVSYNSAFNATVRAALESAQHDDE